MKINKIFGGSTEPTNIVFSKLVKNDFPDENVDAFDFVLSLFNHSISQFNFPSKANASDNQSDENTNVLITNAFFRELIDRYKDYLESSKPAINSTDILNQQDFGLLSNIGEINQELVELKNLTQQNTILNQKISYKILQSIPFQIIQLINEDNINEKTQNELLQIAQIFEKLSFKNKENLSGQKEFDLEQAKENPNSRIIREILSEGNNQSTGRLLEKEELNTRKIENIESNKQFKNIERNEAINAKKSALSPKQILEEQKQIKLLKVENNQQENKIAKIESFVPKIGEKDEQKQSKIEKVLDQPLNSNQIFDEDIDKVIFKEIPNEKTHKSNFEKREIIAARKDVTEKEIPSNTNDFSIDEKKVAIPKSNLEFITPRNGNHTQKVGNFSIFKGIAFNEVPNFIIRMSNSIQSGGNYKAVMNLKPENLGSIFVNLSINNEMVNIVMKIDSLQTFEKIEGSVNQLKEALATNGFKSENINLKVEYNRQDEQNYANQSKYGNNDKQNANNNNRDLHEMIRRIRQYEQILLKVKQQEVVE